LFATSVDLSSNLGS